MSVGTRLKQRRITAGLDIKEVAIRVKKSYQYIRQIEEGINDPPTWALLRELAVLYGCSVDSLLIGDTNDKEIALNTVATSLIKTFHRLPKYRQEDLLNIAELFAKRTEEDDTFALRVILEKIDKFGGEEKKKLLVDLLRTLDWDLDEGSLFESDE